MKKKKLLFHQKKGSKSLMTYDCFSISIKMEYQSGEAYNTNKQIRFKISMLRSDLCDYSNAYIVVKGIVSVSAGERDRDEMNRQVLLKNNAPFISCISEINGVLVENAENLDIVMPMFNLLEYSKNYSKTSGSFWNYYRDELTDDTNDNNNPNKNVISLLSIRQVLQEVLAMFLEE